MEVTLTQLLESREERVRWQAECLKAWPGCSLVCLTVLFPGPVKRDADSVRVGEAGVAAIQKAFPEIAYSEIRDKETGFEACFAVRLPVLEAKRRCCEIEDTHPWGRLMDIDVLEPGPEGLPLPVSRARLGLPERRCLLCDRPARECMRAKTHTLAQLQAQIQNILLSLPL